MTDLSTVLPAFPTDAYSRLIPSLERNLVTTTDLLTLDVVEIAKRAQLPLLDVKRLCEAVLHALEGSLSIAVAVDRVDGSGGNTHSLRKTGNEVIESWTTISTLDEIIDIALGGGIPAGYITEITGEATQLPPPHGVDRAALYISTESALPTTRLSQILLAHPILASADTKPSLDRVISIVTPDLESQDHILRYQLPVAIRRHNIGLVVLDSVAANYRAEFERPGATRNGANMARRSSELVKLGQMLRDLARAENIAVVVSNQVADRFAGSDIRKAHTNNLFLHQSQSSPLAHRGHATGALVQPIYPPSPTAGPQSTNPRTPRPGIGGMDAMTLDHQQRWFTGWGDDPSQTEQKTPSLGLVWTAQIACRIALIKSPIYEEGRGEEETDGPERVLKGWRRWMKVVFAPWVRPSGAGIQGALEFQITSAGIKASAGKEHER